MKKQPTFIRIGVEKLTEPHPAITNERKRLEAKMVSFMVLVMIVGVSLNLVFGDGLTPPTLLVLILGYGFSRTRRYRVATYLIIGILLVSTIQSILVTGDFSHFTIFSNIAWLSLSLVFASLLLSIRETLLISTIHLMILYLMTVFVPGIDLKGIGVSFGFLWVFSALLIIVMWQRNTIEDARQEKIRQQATHDQLTGLPNRVLFHDRLDQALARIERNKTIGSILYLDLDDFKTVNDEFSHEVGDQVLRVIAERILTCIRKTDTAARFSGDEFVVLLEDVSGPDNAGLIAKDMLDAIAAPIKIENAEAMVSGSIGIAMIPDDGMDDSVLIQNADTAMYTAKHDGKNAISYFTVEMKDRMLKSINLSKSLHKALNQDELYLEYQPQYDARTGKAISAEALMRWQHPKRGSIPPKEFIPIAEKNGLIIPMGEWLIRDVFLFQQQLVTSLGEKFRIAVNLSSRQLRDDQFARYLADLIAESGADPQLLELEITENSIFDNLEKTLSILMQIKKLGVRLAIDDFGTGHSSLSYLESLPFDTVKIDISFIQKITGPDVQLPILTGIIAIANEMGKDVIAEGVETDIQLNWLKTRGCHLIQGYYFNPSLSEQGLIQALSEQVNYVVQQPVIYNLASGSSGF